MLLRMLCCECCCECWIANVLNGLAVAAAAANAAVANTALANAAAANTAAANATNTAAANAAANATPVNAAANYAAADAAVIPAALAVHVGDANTVTVRIMGLRRPNVIAPNWTVAFGADTVYISRLRVVGICSCFGFVSLSGSRSLRAQGSRLVGSMVRAARDITRYWFCASLAGRPPHTFRMKTVRRHANDAVGRMSVRQPHHWQACALCGLFRRKACQ